MEPEITPEHFSCDPGSDTAKCRCGVVVTGMELFANDRPGQLASLHDAKLRGLLASQGHLFGQRPA